MQGNAIRDWFADHPKAVAALFSVMLFLSQSQVVMAGAANASDGP